MHSDTFYRIALSRVPHVGPVLTRTLTDHYGSAEAVFRASPTSLRGVPGIHDKIISALQLPAPQKEAEAILSFANQHNINILYYLDEDFPFRLRRKGAPALLYYRGTEALNDLRTVAIVGTRRPSSRGLQQTELLIRDLAGYHPIILSGLAYGIDICAHREALKHGLTTVGVLGSGLNYVYPNAHRNVARKMMESGGLLTTHPHWVSPEREHFPARNRIVSMLADLVVVVESEQQGGSMITARMARELDKPVGACPGRFNDASSAGCNTLIKLHGAALIESAEDIARLLQWQPEHRTARQTSLFTDLDPTEQAIVQQLNEHPEVAVDELRNQLSWPASQLAGCLLRLELKGIIKTLPGPRYRLAQ